MAQKMMRTSGLLRDAHPQDATPRSRDRVVGFAIAVCIIGVLQALYLLNNATMLGKARVTNAVSWEPPTMQPALMETLAFEGALDDAHQRELVRVADMHNGTVAGLKFFIAGDPLYVVNWQCKAATVQEVAEAVQALPEKQAAALKGLTPAELPAGYQFKVCQQGSGRAH